ncbi:MAG TPA: GerMN domain-containing protein [Terriglobales bacterium]|nr:GerMN domain-containing protein [Terriglobales bacterium]
MNTRQFVVTTVVLFALVIAMSVYVSQLRRREIAALRVHSVPKVEHAAPPASGKMEQVSVLVAYDDPGVLRAQSLSIPLTSGRQQRAEELLRALIGVYTAKNSPHLLALGSDVRNVFLVDPGIAVVDLNSTLVDSQVSGVLSEELTIASMVQILANNLPGLTRVKFLVDGKQRDTLAGHVELSQFYEVSQVNQMVEELSR